MKTFTQKRNPEIPEFKYAVVNYYPNGNAAIWYECNLLESAEWYLDEIAKDTRYNLMREFCPEEMANMQVVKLEWN